MRKRVKTNSPKPKNLQANKAPMRRSFGSKVLRASKKQNDSRETITVRLPDMRNAKKGSSRSPAPTPATIGAINKRRSGRKSRQTTGTPTPASANASTNTPTTAPTNDPESKTEDPTVSVTTDSHTPAATPAPAEVAQATEATERVPTNGVDEAARSDVLNVEVDSSESSGPPSTASNKLLKDVSDNSCKPSPSTSIDGERKKRKYEKKKPEELVPSRKSHRINQGDSSSEIVDNYTEKRDYKQPRNNMIPTGLNRVDYKFPPTDKNRDSLKIDMIAQTSNKDDRPSIAEMRRNEKREIRVGPNYQAVLPECEEAQEYLDREEREDIIWTQPVNEFDIHGFCEIYEIARTQYPYQLELDRTLHAFMVNGYDVKETLTNIEEELHLCTQPFKPLNVAQRKEWEKLRNPHKPDKEFRDMQERFLKKHHLGEIISYYYRMKPFTCPFEYGTLKSCKQSIAAVRSCIKRVECGNCTKKYRNNALLDGKLCGFCSLYYKKFHTNRPNPRNLSDYELEFINTWVEEEKKANEKLSLSEIEAVMEEKRKEKMLAKSIYSDDYACVPTKRRKEKKPLVELSKEFQVTKEHKCSLIQPWGVQAAEAAMRNYDNIAKFALVSAFEKHGFDIPKVAADVKMSELEVASFHRRYKTIYSLPQKTSPKELPAKENKKPTRGKKRASSEDSAGTSSKRSK